MLRLLGEPKSYGVGLFPSKAFLVFAFVTLSPDKCISRKKLAEYLWGEVSVKKAYSNLRYVLAKVRIWERLNNTKVVLQQDTVLQGLMPPLDFSLCLRMIWRTTSMLHALDEFMRQMNGK